MTGVTVVAEGAADGLESFVRRALARGLAQFQASGTGARVRVSLAGQSLTIAESQPHLAADVAHCIGSQVPCVKNASDVSVYIDYSGWHLKAGMAELFAPSDTMPMLDARLNRIGLRAVFSNGMQLCDIYDPAQRFGLRLQAGLAATTPWEPTAPLAFFCKWIAEQAGMTMVHAASLQRGGIGALLVGNGGAGKSGTVVGGLLSGFASSGDDYTLIARQDSGWQAHAVYRTVKQDLRGLDRLGLPRATQLNWQNKAVFRPETVGAQAIKDMVPIHVILLPSTGASRTQFQPADPAGACKILAISTLKQIGGNTARVFQTCAEVARALPCFAMVLSPDKDEVAAELATFLGTLSC